MSNFKRFFLNRIESAPEYRTLEERFEAVPATMNLSRSRFDFGDVDTREFLREIRNAMLPIRSVKISDLASLYRVVSHGFDDIGVQVLSEWIIIGDGDKIVAVAMFLLSADNDFVFVRKTFVHDTR